MSRITITRRILDDEQQKVLVYYSDHERGATNQYVELSTKEGVLAKPDWTDEDNCAALLDHIKGEAPERYATLISADVAVAVPPPAPAPEEVEEEVLSAPLAESK